MSEESKTPDARPDSTPADGEETARKTGRGFLVITGAKIWFMITGAVIQLGLPIFLGSPEQFGVFKVVTEAISLVNMVMITGTLQAVSKLVSERPVAARRVINQAVKLQFVLGVPIALGYFLLSPWIADRFNDPTLTPFIQLSSFIILAYSFYAIFVGYLNGVKEFVKQASLDITFATLKMVGIVGLVLLGFGVFGAVAGFVGASAIICVISGVWVWRLLSRQETDDQVAEESASEGIKRLAGYLILIMLFTFALNGLMRADLFVLKSVSAEVPTRLGEVEGIFKLVSNKFAGFYGAVLNIARIPYQGVIAVTFVIFPLISESTFEEDLDRTKTYIRDTMRYCLILIVSVGSLLALNADAIIGGLYSAEYQAAAPALAILSVSIIFFALLYVAATMIIGSGHPAVAVGIMAVSLFMSAGLNWWFVREVHAATLEKLSFTAGTDAGGNASVMVSHAVDVAARRTQFAAEYLSFGPDYMQAAAVATTIAMFVGFVASVAWLWWKFEARPPVATLLRLGAATAVIAAIDYVFVIPMMWIAEHGKLVYLGAVAGKMAVLGLAFLGVIFVLREFGEDDYDRLKAVIGKKSDDDTGEDDNSA
jgi:O-antigen/teichoic acid export membrane protein